MWEVSCNDTKGYYLAWFDEEGEGLRLGPETCQARFGREIVAMSKAIRDLSQNDREELASEWRWETERGAKQALRVALAAEKALKASPAAPRKYPAWAKKALEQGWKPPRGWKP